ncbi:MAG: NAD(P)H-hydrate dehydratase [Pseudomonadota bacterium]
MLNNGYILTADEMRKAEQAVFDRGTTVDQLMYLAGSSAAQQIWRISGQLPTLVACGPGNNGGDGYVIAQWLLEKGVDVRVAATGAPSTDAASNARSAWQGETVTLDDARPARQFVDCLFGTGLTRPLEGNLLDNFHRLATRADRRFAIDLPSGIHSDNGEILSKTPKFEHTLALGAYKPSHFLEPSRGIMGHVSGMNIGIRAKSGLSVIPRPQIGKPATSDHKYSRGLVAVIAGKMAGAAQLSALAAQASGAGYVKIFAPTNISSPQHSIVVERFENAGGLRELLADPRLSSVVIGPGLGRDGEAQKALSEALKTSAPLVVDADALTLMGKDATASVASRSGQTVLTPHMGEFQSILEKADGCKMEEVRKMSGKSYGVMLLKGPDTMIANEQGKVAFSGSRCSWLSTAGSGDVLSGIIAARLASNDNAFVATKEAQWLHTRAAQLAGPAFSPEGLINRLPEALEECL